MSGGINLIMLSIITPCLNRAMFVENAIRSVIDQDYPYIEHLVIDGGSTDGTLEILSKYPHLQVISEPDQGMYDAINKGVSLARGEIISFLNTDDFYEPRVLKSVIKMFKSKPNADAVSGAAEIFCTDEQGEYKLVKIHKSPNKNDLLIRLTEGIPIFNAWFFRANVFDDIGNLNIEYKYSSDRELLIRFYLKGMELISLNEIVYHYRQHPGSSTFSGRFDGEAAFVFENLEIAEKFINNSDLNSDELKQFIMWHSQLTSDQVITAIRRLAINTSAKYAKRGLDYNPRWIWIFLSRLCGGIFRNLTRRTNSITQLANKLMVCFFSF